jgi:lipocalin
MNNIDTSKEVAHVSCCYHKTVWICKRTPYLTKGKEEEIIEISYVK